MQRRFWAWFTFILLCLWAVIAFLIVTAKADGCVTAGDIERLVQEQAPGSQETDLRGNDAAKIEAWVEAHGERNRGEDEFLVFRHDGVDGGLLVGLHRGCAVAHGAVSNSFIQQFVGQGA